MKTFGRDQVLEFLAEIDERNRLGFLAWLLLLACGACNMACGTGSGPAIANPDMANICSWSGALQGIVHGVCPPRENDWAWVTAMNLYAPLSGEGTLDSCPITDDAYLTDLANPGWQLQVEAALPVLPVSNSTDHYYSRLIATRLDGPVPCDVKLVWELKQQRLTIPVGSTLRLFSQITILNVEKDSFRMSLLRDENGGVLVGWVGTIRPAVWYQDIWPEMVLSFASLPVCQKAGYPDSLALRVTLSSGSDTCTLDSGTGTCCSFSGVPYEVQCPDAWHSVSGSWPDYATLLVARKDILMSAP